MFSLWIYVDSFTDIYIYRESEREYSGSYLNLYYKTLLVHLSTLMMRFIINLIWSTEWLYSVIVLFQRPTVILTCWLVVVLVLVGFVCCWMFSDEHVLKRTVWLQSIWSMMLITIENHFDSSLFCFLFLFRNY